MLHHVVQGPGPNTIVFMHGFLGSGRNLGALTRRYAAADPSLRLVQVDLPGHGKSPLLPPRADQKVVVDEILAWADALALENFRVVGHSMGGRLGLALLDRIPGRVSHVDLLDITPGSTHHLPVGDVINPLLAAPEQAPDRRLMQTFFLESGLTPAFTDWLLMNLERVGDRYRWRIDRAALAELHQRHGNVDLWSVVETYSNRIRVVRGGDSKYVSDQDVARFEALDIPVRTVPNAGHFVHAEKPEETFQALMGQPDAE